MGATVPNPPFKTTAFQTCLTIITGDKHYMLGKWGFANDRFGESLDDVSFTRYCIELVDVELTISVGGAVGVGGPTTTSNFANYLSCDAGKCHCPNMVDAFVLRTPESTVFKSCAGYTCQCDASQLQLGRNFTGRAGFQLPICRSPYMSGGQPACPYGGQYPACGASSTVEGAWYSHPEDSRCHSDVKVGDGGCTWHRSPIMHTMTARQLLDAGVFGGQSFFRNTSEKEELHSASVGWQAFASVGAMPCGERLPSTPTPAPAMASTANILV